MPGSGIYAFEVDGQTISTNDPIINGRMIRSSAGLNPVSDYVIIELGSATSRSLGLEEWVDLRVAQNARYLSFEGDRTYSLTINERGYEWGAEELSAKDIRRYAGVPDDHELILDSQRDQPIADDEIIRLSRKGVERVLSRLPAIICIIVNTIEEYVEPGKISFEELAKLAFPDSEETPNTEYTVSYRKGRRDQPEGSLIAGESVKLKKGMIFDVSETDKS
ncbi:multiubiquitin domain-containing protein [Roseibium sp. HPY-6]|uniref:multiubiquitin domain-containing protein n=1 Tax=Roseibium sp. HPY-6 TaxID=3229852 RepID=UPI00338FCCA3